MAKRDDTERNDALMNPHFSQKAPHQKHMSLSPVRNSGKVARGVVAANNNNTNNGGASYRQRLMTEHSNPRDSSRDQINSIKDFAESNLWSLLDCLYDGIFLLLMAKLWLGGKILLFSLDFILFEVMNSIRVSLLISILLDGVKDNLSFHILFML